MTKANIRLLLLAGAAAGSLTASAQTATHHTTTPSTVHHTAATTTPAAHSDCVVEPTLPSQIPVVPAGTPCPKAMVSISEDIQFSPLVGPELRSAFPNLPSKFSLDYQDITVGTGEAAHPHMYYTVKYTGYLMDGSKFDASDDHPETKSGISFPYGAHHVIPGWDMGFEGMHIGGKRRLFIPYQLAYGERGRPPAIPAKSELIFDMELVAQSATDPNAPPTPPTPPTPPASPTSPAVPPSPGAPATTPPATAPQAPNATSPAPSTTPQPATSTTPQASTTPKP